MTTDYHTAVAFKAQADAASINAPLGELDEAIGHIIDGTTEIELNCSDFSDAQHPHTDAATGGKIGATGIEAGSIADGWVMTANGGVSGWERPSGDALPGDILPSARTAKTGWLICNGAAVSRVTYSELFAEIGVTFGSGNGSTTFNLPDLRGRIPVGLDNMGGAEANRITDDAADTLGDSIGGETSVLTGEHIPEHNHQFLTHAATSAGSGTNEDMVFSTGAAHFATERDGSQDYPRYSTYMRGGTSGDNVWIDTPLENNSAPIIQGGGNGNGHPNIQPSLFVNYFVKY